MEKIIRVALSTKFGKDVDTLLELADMTPNREHAVELLLGIYEEPIFKALHKYTYKYRGAEFKDLPACFNEYNPWNRTMLITVVRPVTKDLVVLVENQDIVNADNYTEYEVPREIYSKLDRNAWERISITLNEKEHVKEIVQDYDVIADWFETNTESEL